MANEEEADAQLESSRAAGAVHAQPSHAVPALTTSGAGVAGILRREAQLAAQNDE